MLADTSLLRLLLHQLGFTNGNKYITPADVDHALAVVPATVAQLREHAHTVEYG